ncbi:MAG: CopG family ribbon-helix-helix protein [Rhodospirillales bacterium]|jgi:predicted transcriptional regulator
MDGGGRTRITIDLDDDLVAAIDHLVTLTQRDRSWIVTRAVKGYLRTDGARIMEEAEAFASLERGEGYDMEDVMAECRAIIEAAERRQARKAG